MPILGLLFQLHLYSIDISSLNHWVNHVNHFQYPMCSREEPTVSSSTILCSEKSPLAVFQSESSLDITLIADSYKSEEKTPAVLNVDHEDIPVKLITRGASRRRCDQPPLKLEFDQNSKASKKKTVLKGLNHEVKLVFPCTKEPSKELNFELEYMSYKFLECYRLPHLKVRLLNIKTADQNNLKGMMIEPIDDLVDRCEQGVKKYTITSMTDKYKKYSEIKKISDFENVNHEINIIKPLLELDIAERLIGNSDYDSKELNIKRIEKGSSTQFIAYDFDNSALASDNVEPSSLFQSLLKKDYGEFWSEVTDKKRKEYKEKIVCPRLKDLQQYTTLCDSMITSASVSTSAKDRSKRWNASISQSLADYVDRECKNN